MFIGIGIGISSGKTAAGGSGGSSELIEDPYFASGDGWTAGETWAISKKQAVYAGMFASDLTATLLQPLEVGQLYILTVDWVGFGDNCGVASTGIFEQIFDPFTSIPPGTEMEIEAFFANFTLRIRPGNATAGTLTRVSLVKL